MRRDRTQRVERWAVRRVHDIVEGDLDWHFGAEPLPDYGVDGLAEVVTEDDVVTGRLLIFVLVILLSPGHSWSG